MAKVYDYVAAATETVVSLLQDLVMERSTMFLADGYNADSHDYHVSSILDYLSLEADGPESAFALNAMTLCLDMADWKTVCQECGIDYHADLSPDPLGDVPYRIGAFETTANMLRQARRAEGGG